ncbi:MAG: DMT family transporter [Pseudomonadota bacterium]
MSAQAGAGALAAVLAATLWGSTGTTQALFLSAADPIAVGALRLIVGAAALLCMLVVPPNGLRALKRLPWRGVLPAGCAIAAYNLLFFQAVLHAGVGVGTAVAIGSAPIWATAWEMVRKRRALDPLRIAAQSAAIAGVAVLSLASDGGEAGGTGVLLALGAGAAYATYSLITSATGRHAPPVAMAAATFATAGLAAAPALAFVSLGGLDDAPAMAAVGFLGVAATGVAYALYTWGLTRISASTGVTLALCEPVAAWALATALLGEETTVAKATGALLILIGLVVFTRAKSEP